MLHAILLHQYSEKMEKSEKGRQQKQWDKSQWGKPRFSERKFERTFCNRKNKDIQQGIIVERECTYKYIPILLVFMYIKIKTHIYFLKFQSIVSSICWQQAYLARRQIFHKNKAGKKKKGKFSFLPPPPPPFSLSLYIPYKRFKNGISLLEENH